MATIPFRYPASTIRAVVNSTWDRSWSLGEHSPQSVLRRMTTRVGVAPNQFGLHVCDDVGGDYTNESRARKRNQRNARRKLWHGPRCFLIRACTLPAAMTLLVLFPIGARASTPPTSTLPLSPPVPPSPSNFSAATTAASFVVPGLPRVGSSTAGGGRKAKNLTFIRCAAPGTIAGIAECETLLSHSRVECGLAPVWGNATMEPICNCLVFAGLTPPGSCQDATCVWGPDACSTRQWSAYFDLGLNLLSFLPTLCAFFLGVSCVVTRSSALGRDATTVTLVATTISALFHVRFWHDALSHTRWKCVTSLHRKNWPFLIDLSHVTRSACSHSPSLRSHTPAVIVESGHPHWQQHSPLGQNLLGISEAGGNHRM